MDEEYELRSQPDLQNCTILTLNETKISNDQNDSLKLSEVLRKFWEMASMAMMVVENDFLNKLNVCACVCACV